MAFSLSSTTELSAAILCFRTVYDHYFFVRKCFKRINHNFQRVVNYNLRDIMMHASVHKRAWKKRIIYQNYRQTISISMPTAFSRFEFFKIFEIRKESKFRFLNFFFKIQKYKLCHIWIPHIFLIIMDILFVKFRFTDLKI